MRTHAHTQAHTHTHRAHPRPRQGHLSCQPREQVSRFLGPASILLRSQEPRTPGTHPLETLSALARPTPMLERPASGEGMPFLPPAPALPASRGTARPLAAGGEGAARAPRGRASPGLPGGSPERARSSHTHSPPSEHQARGQRAPPLSRHCGLAGSQGCGHGGHLGPLLRARPSDSMSGESLPLKTAWPVSRGVCRCRRSRVVAVRAVYEAGSGQGSCMFCPTPTDSLSGNEMLY